MLVISQTVLYLNFKECKNLVWNQIWGAPTWLHNEQFIYLLTLVILHFASQPLSLNQHRPAVNFLDAIKVKQRADLWTVDPSFPQNWRNIFLVNRSVNHLFCHQRGRCQSLPVLTLEVLWEYKDGEQLWPCQPSRVWCGKWAGRKGRRPGESSLGCPTSPPAPQWPGTHNHSSPSWITQTSV